MENGIEDGTKRVVNPGEILKVRDLTGPGHAIRSVGNRLSARVRRPVNVTTKTLFQVWICLGWTSIRRQRLYLAHDLVTPMARPTLIRRREA